MFPPQIGQVTRSTAIITYRAAINRINATAPPKDIAFRFLTDLYMYKSNKDEYIKLHTIRTRICAHDLSKAYFYRYLTCGR